MLVSFRPCRPKDHDALLKLIVTYYRSSKIPFNRKSLTKGLDTLLRNVSQGQAWLMDNHKKPVGYALLTYNFDLEYGGVEGLLIDLYVEKRFRNRALARFCTQRGRLCRERVSGPSSCRLHTTTRSRGLYRKADSIS
jgi:hypothetical protein